MDSELKVITLEDSCQCEVPVPCLEMCGFFYTLPHNEWQALCDCLAAEPGSEMICHGLLWRSVTDGIVTLAAPLCPKHHPLSNEELAMSRIVDSSNTQVRQHN